MNIFPLVVKTLMHNDAVPPPNDSRGYSHSSPSGLSPKQPRPGQNPEGLQQQYPRVKPVAEKYAHLAQS